MRAAKVKTKTKDYSPPGSKKRGRAKFEPETMVLMPAVPAESVTQYSLSLPSANKDRMLDEMDMLRNITENLNKIVSTMEGTYTKDDEIEEEGEYEEEEEPAAPKEEHEDMTSFLICCSHLRNQLEKALYEEKQILESLLKWFEKEVHEMEEMGEEQLIPDWQIPLADKNITDNISKLLNRIQRLEELKGRIQELPKLIQLSAPKQEKKRPITPVAPAQKDPRNIIEELAMKHATEDVMNMVQVFQDDAGQPQTIETMNNRMIEIMKVFERQTNKLHRVANEQDVLEGKLQKIQQEFRKLAEEKEIMEDELQKMKGSELPEKVGPDARKKILQKVEKAKGEEKPSSVPAEKVQPFAGRQKEHHKMKEDLAKAQANIQSLENEKKMLEEKLKKALEEAEMAKSQLAEIPPTIPDWQFPYTTVVEDDKDIPKKGKKMKSKGRGEDRTDLKQLSGSGLDRAGHKLQRDTGKAGEAQDLSTAPELKDVKQKKKLSGAQEKELPKQVSQSEITSRDKKEESKKMKVKTEGKSETVDSKGAAKSKETAEIKRGRSIIKGTGKEIPPPIQEKEQLPDSTEIKKMLPVTLDTSPEETLPPDSKRRKTEIMMSPEFDTKEEKEDSLSSEQKPLPKFQVEESAELEKIMGVSETGPEVGIVVTPEPTDTMEGIPAVLTSGKILTEEGIPGVPIDVRYGDVETKDRINKTMLQLANNLKELEGMPEAETLAKLLLEPGKSMDELSDRQKLQLLQTLNELVTPDEIQQTGKEEEEQKEKKRKLFENVASNLHHLQQIQVPEAGQSEEEINEMRKKRRFLLGNLESILEDVEQPKSAVEPTQEDFDREINKLSEERSLLLASLESNMKDLEQAQALATAQPSEGNENKIKELLKQRELLAANLETNLHDLQRLKSFEIGLTEKDRHGDKLEELTKQRKHLAEELKAAVTDIQEMRRPSQRSLFARPSELEVYQMYKLSEKKQQLLEKLKSNQKELQEAQELAATQPGSVNEQKLQELADQNKYLTAELESTLEEMQRTVFLQPVEREIDELSSRKQDLLEKLESNRKELQEAQELAVIKPGSISEHKLQELMKQRRHLTADLETTMYELQKARDFASEGVAIIRPSGRQLYELSSKKQELLEKLESNQKELQEAQELAATQPGSISEHKLQELTEQRKLLTKELEETLYDIRKAEQYASGRALTGRPAEKELHDLSVKKHILEEKLEYNRKELEEARNLAASHPGSISEHKLQELEEQGRALAADLQATMQHIQKVHSVSERTQLELAERALYELSEKKHLLQSYLESNLKAIQEAQALAAIQPDSVSEHKLQELFEERRRLTADLKAAEQDLREAEHRALDRALIEQPTDSELYDLFEKKNLLQANLDSNWKELQEAQSLAATQPGSVNEQRLQKLNEERRYLAEDLQKTVRDIVQRSFSIKGLTGKPVETELYELSERKQQLLEKLKGLQELQAIAATQPGIAGEEKRKQLAEQRRHLAADLEATVHDMQKAQHISETPLMLRPSEMKLYELSEKKRLLLESLASNRKELQEAQALADAQPGSISGWDLYKLSQWKQLLLEHLESHLKETHALATTEPDEKKIQELNEQRKILIENLEAVVQDIQELKAHISEATSTIKPIDSGQLLERKKWLLECLEMNMKNLQAAQRFAATNPSTINEQKVQDLIDERRLLTAGLEAVIQDLQDIESLPQEEVGKKTREKILEELSEKKRIFLQNLASNLKDLKEAQALAAAQPDGISEQKVQELTEQRRLLAVGLEAIVREIQGLVSGKVEILQPSERELAKLSEKRIVFFENMELNLEEMKDLQALERSGLHGMNEQKMQQLAEKRALLAANFESFLEDMQEAQDVDSDHIVMTRPDERKVNDLIELSRLETKLDELEEVEALSHHQFNNIRSKIHKLKQQKRNLIDKWEVPPLDGYPEAYVIDKKDKEKAVKEFLEQRKGLFTYLQSSIRDLQQKGIIQQGSVPEDITEDISEEGDVLDLMVVPIDLLQSEAAPFGTKYGQIDEKTAKRKALAAKLEANIKDFQAGFEAEKIEKTRHAGPREFSETPGRPRIIITAQSSDQQQIKPSHSGLQIQISKAPVIRRLKSDRTPQKRTVVQDQQDDAVLPRIPKPDYTDIKTPEIELDAAVQDQQDKSIYKEIESTSRRQQPLTLPLLSPSGVDVRHPVDDALQEILNYNKSLLPSHKANLQKALQIAQQQLQQQQASMLAEKLRNISAFFPQPPGTTRFHDYSLQPSQPGWESNQLPQKGYAHKLKMLKRKILGPELKALWQAPPPTQGPGTAANLDQEADPIVICGKGVSPYRKHGAFPVIKQNLRH
nr:interaptin isoform X5 [Pogona vitticeps]